VVIDLENKIFDDFLVAPIRRYEIVLGYALSAFIIGFIMTLITFIGAQIFMVIGGGTVLSVLSHLKVIGLIALSNVVFSGVSFLIVSFIKSVSSVNAINTIIGTTIGFLAGIYVPFSAFSDTFGNIIKFNPAAHLVTAFRSVLMEPALAFVFKEAPSSVRLDYEMAYGVRLEWFNQAFELPWILVYVTVFAFVFYGLSILRMKHFKR